MLGTLLHVVASGGLFLAAFMFGMASFTSGDGSEARFLMKTFDVWHAPYMLVWKPITAKVLPAIPPAEAMPKEGDKEGWRIYEAHRTDTFRIAGIHTSVRNLGYVFSSIVCGFIFGGIYVSLKKQNKTRG
jgi:hypothetical protein